MKYYSLSEVARIIGVTPPTIKYYVWRYNVGTDIAGRTVYTDADIKAIQDRRNQK